MKASCLNWVPLLAILPAFAQDRPAADRRISLDVVVTDKSGRTVAGLQQSDFTLLDNKRPVKISSFRGVEKGDKSEPPVETIILLDGVNSTAENVAVQQGEVQAFLKKNGADLGPGALVLFSFDGAAVANASTSAGAKALMDALNQGRNGQIVTGVQAEAYGIDGFQQLSLYTLDRLADFEAARPARKLLIWISPGWPLLAGTDNGALNPKHQQDLFATIVSLSEKLRRARIALYNVDPEGLADANDFGTSAYGQFVPGVKKPGQVQMGNLGLQVLATQSGGLVLNSSNDVAGEIATCIADANAYYALTFDGAPGDGPNEYHSLEIKIGRSGLKARTDTGYYAQPGKRQ